MQSRGLRACVFVFAATVPSILSIQAFAQEARWELMDTGVLDHSTHGSGIEMRIKPVPWPKNLFDDPELPNLMAALCNHYAPSVIPWVKEQAGISDPEFIAVRLISGGSVGRYVLQAFAISEGSCGDEL